MTDDPNIIKNGNKKPKVYSSKIKSIFLSPMVGFKLGKTKIACFEVKLRYEGN